jgi:hypothetical protein
LQNDGPPCRWFANKLKCFLWTRENRGQLHRRSLRHHLVRSRAFSLLTRARAHGITEEPQVDLDEERGRGRHRLAVCQARTVLPNLETGLIPWPRCGLQSNSNEGGGHPSIHHSWEIPKECFSNGEACEFGLWGPTFETTHRHADSPNSSLVVVSTRSIEFPRSALDSIVTGTRNLRDWAPGKRLHRDSPCCA